MRISDWSSDVCSSDLGVLADDRVRLRRQRFLARTDVHAAARIPRTVHARWSIAAARAVDCHFSFDPGTQRIGYCVERGVLIREVGIAADRRNGEAEQAGDRKSVV